LSNIEGGCEAVEHARGGVANFDADPDFADTDIGDFRLNADSPCIDRGNDSLAPLEDKDGNPRRDVASVSNCEDASEDACGYYSDVGAYEY